MGEKRGLFVVFEGIDGSGKSTQITYLAQAIQRANKYQDVLLTREPTWRAAELKERLQSNADVFTGGERDAHLFVEDRKVHTLEQIVPALNQRAIVICDRYSMSTCAYQSAQGVDINNLFDLHEKAQTLTPDVAFYVNVSQQVAEERMIKRGAAKEKFEGNKLFTKKLIEQYRTLASLSDVDGSRTQRVIGKVILINGEQPMEKVTKDIADKFMHIYEAWRSS